MQLTIDSAECQQMQVLKHLRKGNTITNMDAFWKFNITRLGDVIYRLREKKHIIKTDLVPNQNNHHKHARYTLIEEAKVCE